MCGVIHCVNRFFSFSHIIWYVKVDKRVVGLLYTCRPLTPPPKNATIARRSHRARDSRIPIIFYTIIILWFYITETDLYAKSEWKQEVRSSPRRIRVAGRISCRPMAVSPFWGGCRVGRWLYSYFGKRPVRFRAQYIILLSSLCIYV